MFKYLKRLISPVEYRAPIYIFGFEGVLTIGGAAANEDWRALNRARPNNAVIATMYALLYCGCDVRIWTGRCESERIEIVHWLSQHLNIKEKEVNKMLFMRYGDKADVAEGLDEASLKEFWLHGMSNKEHFRIAAAYEFSTDSCNMFRRNDITCFQVFEA